MRLLVRSVKSTPFRQFVLAIPLFIASSIGYAQTDTLPAVLLAERARFEAQIATDTTALRALLHPNLLFIHSNGREESADDMVTSVATGDIVYQQFKPLRPPQVISLGRTALVDGTVRVVGLYEGDEFTVDLRYTSVYRRVRGRWLLIRWQSLKLVGS